MSGIFSTLNTANKGMHAQQTALQTVGHNISNANTPGFSRQRVEFKADTPHTVLGVGKLGSGVKMDGIIRIVDDYVTKQIRDESGHFNRYYAKSNMLGQLEIIYNEPSETGLNFNISEIFKSWHELGKNPENNSAKTIVVEKSVTFADTFNHIKNQMDSLEKETESLIEKEVMDINAILDNVDSLNRQIFNTAIKGYSPNDLLDKRDMYLQELSQRVDIKTTFDQYGRVGVSVDGTHAIELGVDGVNHLSYNSTDMELDGNTINLTKGSIRGYMDAKEFIQNQIAELVEFGETIAETFNEGHTLDEFGNPVAGAIDFFIFDGVTGNIKVNDVLVNDSNLVLSGKDYTSPPGDGSRAYEIGNIKSKVVTFGTETATIENRYNTIITKMGISKQHADNMVSNQEVLIGQLEARRESTSGVSIDEEITNLVKFQKAYDASAKVIATLVEMLDTLIHRMGV